MYLQAQIPATLWAQYGLADLPTEARYFVLAAAGMLSLSILAMLSLYLRRWWMNKQEKKKADIKFRYQYFIYDALVGKRNNEDMPSVELIINRFRQEELNSSLKKQIMTDLLIELKRSFTGTSAGQFVKLYHGLGLQAFAVAKLRKSGSVSRIQGLRELSELAPDNPQLAQAITQWQDAANPYLADEARLAAIRTQSACMFSFLQKMRQPAGEWLQINLHRLLRGIPETQRPVLAQWLNQDNPFAARLILRLISVLKQQASVEKVISQLQHPDNEVKREALHCLLALEAREAVSKIFNLLDTENESLKLLAIQTIGALGSSYHARLLRPLLQSASQLVRDTTDQAINRIAQGSSQTHPSQSPYSVTSNH